MRALLLYFREVTIQSFFTQSEVPDLSFLKFFDSSVLHATPPPPRPSAPLNQKSKLFQTKLLINLILVRYCCLTCFVKNHWPISQKKK